MSLTGNPSSLRQALQFPSGFVREIFSLIIDIWANIVFPPGANAEVPMTNFLHETLIDAYEHRGLPWFISLEQPVVDRATGQAPGRTDIRFLHRQLPGQKTFFVVETKRLNITSGKGKQINSNAAAYVNDGMIRFINGQYSQHLPSGAMIGYVMNSQTSVARSKVNAKIAQESAILRCDGQPTITACVEQFPANMGGQTQHNRLSEHGGKFIMYHLFLAVEARHFN